MVDRGGVSPPTLQPEIHQHNLNNDLFLSETLENHEQ